MKQTKARIQDISNKLCEEFQRVVPLHPGKLKRGKKLSESELHSSSEMALKEFYEVARNERLRHQLGIIGRARVAFDLQQRLLNAGYPSPLVKQVLFAMLTAVFVGDKH